MADLAASDVTVTLSKRSRIERARVAWVTIALGDGAKTVPAGGVPLPTPLSKYGMFKEMDLFIINPVASGYPVEYDKANHKLLYYIGDYSNANDGPLLAATGAAPAAHTLRALVIGR